MKVLVTGGTGLLGRTLKDRMSKWIYVGSKDCDLKSQWDVNGFFSKINPDKVIHLAARVGGIQKNIAEPYPFIFDNLQINANVINWCYENNKPILFASSSCVYPNYSETYPLKEDQVDEGPPEITNCFYSYSKRIGNHLLRAAAKQIGLQYYTLYFSNLYGEHDFTDKNDLKHHLITALFEKMTNAKKNNVPSVELLGDGTPLRQFMYAGDAAEIIVECIYEELEGEYNVAPNENLSVFEIAKAVKETVGYEGTMFFNGEMNGIFRKDICSEKLLKVINHKFISLNEGLKITYKKLLELECGN